MQLRKKKQITPVTQAEARLLRRLSRQLENGVNVGRTHKYSVNNLSCQLRYKLAHRRFVRIDREADRHVVS